ncbi:MAG: hypothetical protein COU47_04150 [Candidatus Niyogibacteria bacterium CG10_big_fil_rev_8_21_14_0_10_46_36]|uniref:Type II secretion system protein GspG C-terminal domain-containing protein n=1 Tax=Candidatus Niyogibacteria bacterium CG10_big_fil_rev_8_21_14_0_10_46_36 TaxID=1974726 RepID=A0A2H0TCH5_9BACT|nr:MAG: hypothetical protein COU47_04150 [Candidatus Niyogibacteria bacterium CG10_big_fil_rev_8_21_14_0_10_46_36]
METSLLLRRDMTSNIMKQSYGFTLIELLVVVAIIGTLASVILASVNNARKNSRAARIVADMDAIAKGWRLWQADTNTVFINENTYGNVNADAPCHDEPVLSDTDLFSDASGTPGWNGPYLQAIPLDPFGREYSYDYDSDTWNPPGNKWGGVNIQIQWCSGEGAEYLELAPLIDAAYDNGDGADLGIFKWDNSAPGGYGILLAPAGNQ